MSAVELSKDLNSQNSPDSFAEIPCAIGACALGRNTKLAGLIKKPSLRLCGRRQGSVIKLALRIELAENTSPAKNKIRVICESSGVVSGCLLPRAFREICV